MNVVSLRAVGLRHARPAAWRNEFSVVSPGVSSGGSAAERAAFPALPVSASVWWVGCVIGAVDGGRYLLGRDLAVGEGSGR